MKKGVLYNGIIYKDFQFCSLVETCCDRLYYCDISKLSLNKFKGAL